MPIELQLSLTALLAFYVAWNLGANDVANSMGTSVGSKAVTLRQALIIAGILEFGGALIFGQGVSKTLGTEVANPTLFADQPQLLLLGMISVLIAGGLWLQIATRQGLPVASSHAVVGAIAGFSAVAVGVRAVRWVSLGQICLGWLISPVISGAIASLFYLVVKRYILNSPDPIAQLQEWIPWLSSLLIGIFGIIVLPTVFNNPFFEALPIPTYDFPLITGTVAVMGLTWTSWQQLEHRKTQQNDPNAQITPTTIVEQQLGRFQVLSACFVAFAHGSNDVGNAVAPLAVIASILRTGEVPLGDFVVPTWVLVVGGLGIVSGLAVQGKNVITTVGEEIIPLQPSSGFCAELATATTVLIASRLGFPVSTSQALVGAVVGIGLVQIGEKVQFSTVRSVALAWIVTLPVTALLCAVIFKILSLVITS
jgi:PiT family inorganic phosphate transporter